MTFQGALSKLFADVQALAVAESVTASIVYGDREPHKSTNQGTGRANRIVFAPGDDKGKAGKWLPAKRPGRNPRPVATWHELCRVYVWAHDGSAGAARDDLKQDEAARALIEWTVRAIHLSAHGTYVLEEPHWLRTPKDVARFGAELVFNLWIENPILDTPYQTAPDGTTAQTVTVIALPGGDVPAC